MKQQNAIREQQSLEAAQGKAKEKFNKEELKYHNDILTLGRTNIKEALKYIDIEGKQSSKAAEDEIDAIEERMAKENLLNETGLSQDEIRQAAFEEFHATNMENAKIRAGVHSGEIKTLESQMTAAEAFSAAMEELKTQFSKLVGSGAVEDITGGLINFVQRVKDVGFFKATMGMGDSEADLRESGRYGANFKAMEEEGFSTKEGAAGAANILAKATIGGGTNDTAVAAVLDRIKSKEDLAAIKEEIKNLSTYNNMGQLQNRGLNFEYLLKGEGLDMDAINKKLDNLPDRAELNKKLAVPPADDVKDFILRPGQRPIKFDKGDLLMGGTQLGQGGGKVESLLEQLLEETRSGKIIKMDTATVGRSLQLNKSKMNY